MASAAHRAATIIRSWSSPLPEFSVAAIEDNFFCLNSGASATPKSTTVDEIRLHLIYLLLAKIFIDA
jgi:hypothetical protein